MDHPPPKQSTSEEEVSSMEWEFINMSDQEEDLIRRMHRLVGDRWDLIAGRIPGRKAEEIERFWIMKHFTQPFSATATTIINFTLPSPSLTLPHT